MRQEHETATSFNQLQEITQAMRALKNGAPKNATNQESERTQEITSAKAHVQKLEQEIDLKPKATTRAKNHALKPTKKAFSERQNTAFRDKSQASANKSQETKQANNSSLREKPSDEAFTSGLATHQEKGGNNEA